MYGIESDLSFNKSITLSVYILAEGFLCSNGIKEIKGLVNKEYKLMENINTTNELLTKLRNIMKDINIMLSQLDTNNIDCPTQIKFYESLIEINNRLFIDDVQNYENNIFRDLYVIMSWPYMIVKRYTPEHNKILMNRYFINNQDQCRIL
jgi:hypothetical protein